MDGDFPDLASILRLEPHGPDTYVGAGPDYPWGPRIYGGQVIAQALRAAAHTVDPAYQPHSVHAYFIRAGDSSQPVRFEVDRLRDGRSFVTRQVVARQSTGAILNCSASFQRPEVDDEASPKTMPTGIPDPEDLPETGFGADWLGHRDVPMENHFARSRAWLRSPHPLGDDPVLQACGLAFISDDTPMESIAAAHRRFPPPLDGWGETFMSATLDHTVWFHEPVIADEWVLVDLETQRLHGGRGLAVGGVYRRDGRHIATIAQEGLLREARPPQTG